MLIKTPTLDKTKIYGTALGLCWITILSCLLLKFFGFREFILPDFTNSLNPWIRRTINLFTYELNSMFYLIILIKRKPTVKEITLMLCLSLIPFALSLFTITYNFKIIAEISIYFIVGLYCIKDKWYKILLESILILGIFTVYQVITFGYKEINPHIIVDNFILEKILSLDLYIMLLLTALHNLKKGGYIYDRWFRFLVILSKRIFSKKSLQQNQKLIKEVDKDRAQDVENELGYKIFIIILSIFQYTVVGTACYFVNNVVLEYIIVTISFFTLRSVFGKSYHVNSIIKCTTLSIIVFISTTRLTLPLEVSILFNIVLGLVVAYMMYVMYHYVKYTNAQGITLERGMTKHDLDTLCEYYNIEHIEKAVLTDFYCNRFKIPKIAMKYNYSVDNINKIKAKAIKKIRN